MNEYCFIYLTLFIQPDNYSDMKCNTSVHVQEHHTLSKSTVPSARVPYPRQEYHTLSKSTVPSARVPYPQQEYRTLSKSTVPSARVPYPQQEYRTLSKSTVPSARVLYMYKIELVLRIKLLQNRH